MKRTEFIQLLGFTAASVSLKPYRKSWPGWKNDRLVASPLMAGEVSPHQVILQTRLCEQKLIPEKKYDTAREIIDTEIQGVPGEARFEIADNKEFENSKLASWQKAILDHDYMVKQRFQKLKNDTTYYYRIHFKNQNTNEQVSEIGEFKTLPGENSNRPTRFVISSCLNFGRFFLGHHFGQDANPESWQQPYEGSDRTLGYPGLKAIKDVNPDFWVQTGDNVYYDQPPNFKATTKSELRAKWHRQMGLSRMHDLLKRIPVFWMKDDHDFRFDDADNSNPHRQPSSELGMETFREQVPVALFDSKNKPTYRTYKVNDLLQIWMTEGRDYRSPNSDNDGPGKTIWGKEQNEWLRNTLLKSDATFKILIVPSPLIGPDDARKHDNHVDYGGFQYERDQFFRWLDTHNFQNKNFYIITGDRHWQYHSMHPLGFEEFGTGTLVTQNSRIGRESGDPASTDPLGLIKQPYIQNPPTGGFIQIDVNKPDKNMNATLQLHFIDEYGNELNRIEKRLDSN